MIYLQDDASRHAKMRVPKLHDNLSWGKQRRSTENVALSAAVSSINKFANDGSFMHGFRHGKNADSGDPLHSSSSKTEEVEQEVIQKSSEDAASMKPALSANQLAAKVLQLRMKGLHDEAEKLLVSVIFLNVFFSFHIYLNIFLMQGISV